MVVTRTKRIPEKAVENAKICRKTAFFYKKVLKSSKDISEIKAGLPGMKGAGIVYFSSAGAGEFLNKESSMDPWGFLFIFIGIFSGAVGIFDWDWCMKTGKARLLCALIGRMGTRIFYTVFGLGVFAYGLMILKGIVEFNPGQ